MSYKRVILFGAGASFGSSGILPVSPPLGADLYRFLAKAFPKTWGAVSSELQLKFEEHFESGMGVLWSMYPKALSPLKPGAPSPHVLMQDLTRFFISFRIAPNQQDAYSRFLVKLWYCSKGDNTCFATLNYEILLEQAMTSLGLRPCVVRPHGGCHLWTKRGGKIYGKDKAMGQGFNSVSSRVKRLCIQDIVKLLNKPNQAKYPCMAIYVEDKVTQMGQRYLWRIQDRFNKRVYGCESIVLIGVRPWPKDSHIWSSIFETKAKVFYVGGQVDYDVLKKHRGQDSQNEFVSDSFENVIDDLVKII